MHCAQDWQCHVAVGDTERLQKQMVRVVQINDEANGAINVLASEVMGHQDFLFSFMVRKGNSIS